MTAPRQYPSQERLRELFDYDPDQGQLIRKGKYQRKQSALASESYRKKVVDGLSYRHHRLIWSWHHGDPGKVEVDHINRDRHDDRIENLRLATHSENGRNSNIFAHNTSGLKGVSYIARDKKWRAQIMLNLSNKSLGHFPTKEEAAACYQKAAAEMHGEFAGAFS